MRRGRITYVGHATTLIELDGAVVLTDPLLRARIGHVRRIAPPAAELPELDAVLISHAHRDHLDLPSLRRAPRVAPAGISDVILRCALPEAAQGLNVARIASLRAGLPVTAAAVTINRFCSSGLQSSAFAAERIMACLVERKLVV